jgi:GNAT superfamily N-acetyltransferase
MTEIHIRLARHGEIPLLQDVERDAGALFRSVGMDDVADNPPKDAAELDEAICRNLLWVACDPDDAPIGMAQVIDHGGVAHLEEISVRVAAGGKGVGTALLRAVMRELRERGYGRMTLATFSHLAWNQPFYERLGFTVVRDAAWTPPLRQVRRNEAAMGLDLDARVIMAAAL